MLTSEAKQWLYSPGYTSLLTTLACMVMIWIYTIPAVPVPPEYQYQQFQYQYHHSTRHVSQVCITKTCPPHLLHSLDSLYLASSQCEDKYHTWWGISLLWPSNQWWSYFITCLHRRHSTACLYKLQLPSSSSSKHSWLWPWPRPDWRASSTAKETCPHDSL